MYLLDLGVKGLQVYTHCLSFIQTNTTLISSVLGGYLPQQDTNHEWTLSLP